MVGPVSEEGLPPPLGVGFVAIDKRDMHIRVLRDAVIESAVIECHRDIVLYIEAPIGMICPDSRQLQVRCRVTLVSSVQARARENLGRVSRIRHSRVVVRQETHHAFVDVGPGEVHAVVVEPQERLHLGRIAPRRVTEIEVIAPVTRYVTSIVDLHVVRLAVALRRRMAVVQMGEERIVRAPRSPDDQGSMDCRQDRSRSGQEQVSHTPH